MGVGVIGCLWTRVWVVGVHEYEVCDCMVLYECACACARAIACACECACMSPRVCLRVRVCAFEANNTYFVLFA